MAAYLPPAYRVPGDDWAGSNALLFAVYTVPPAQDGTGGTPVNITGYTASGTVEYMPKAQFGPQEILTPSGNVQALTGAIVDGPAGKFSLSLTKDLTALYPRQSPVAATATLLVRAKLTDPSGNLVTYGVQPLFTSP